jgi:prolyl-tRNA editing enzyme YbaK/EbsC (Cys-tRNA(Pro) deacylase)
MSKSLKRVRAALRVAGLPADPLEMADGTRTAEEAAAAAGCTPDQICKSIIFQGHDSGECLLFLTAGGNRVDAAKAADVAGEALDRADAAAVRARTGFAIGGVAPIGHLHPIRAFWDPRLSDFAEIWAAAGTPRHVFPVAPADLRRLAGAQPADFTA